MYYRDTNTNKGMEQKKEAAHYYDSLDAINCAELLVQIEAQYWHSLEITASINVQRNALKAQLGRLSLDSHHA